MKLNALLAVNENLKTQAEKNRTDLANTFVKKGHHFSEKIVTFTPNTEGASPVTESQLDLQTTIGEELTWLKPFLVKAIDSGNTIAVANTQAKADVILEGEITPLLKDVPATSLLELGKRVNELLEFAKLIPTLDPAKGFLPDAARGAGIFKARDEVKVRTIASQEALVLYPATDKHPAQTQLITKHLPAGSVTTREWSGLLTVADKGKLLERIEKLARAIAQARARANDTEIPGDTAKIGDVLIGYAFGL